MFATYLPGMNVYIGWLTVLCSGTAIAGQWTCHSADCVKLVCK